MQKIWKFILILNLLIMKILVKKRKKLRLGHNNIDKIITL